MRITRIVFALLLIMIGGLIMGCQALSSVPPTSSYPADISGRVTITDSLVVWAYQREATGELAEGETGVFWVVEISVKNNAYVSSVKGEWGQWSILAGSSVYTIPNIFKNYAIQSSPLDVAPGKTGTATFVFTVPAKLKISDALMRYQGQEPYSYGKLSGGTRVTAYDWNAKRSEEFKETTPASIPKPAANIVGEIQGIRAEWLPYNVYYPTVLAVLVKPNESAVAGKDYIVELYEKGSLRATSRVSWNQPQLNVKEVAVVYFPLTAEEYDAYHGKDISHIFSAKVY